MGKPEVQPLVAFILGRRQVFVFLLGGHAIPSLFTCLVSAHVVAFYEDRHNNIPCDKRKKDFVTPSVVWLIVFSVDLSVRQSRPRNVKAKGRTWCSHWTR